MDNIQVRDDELFYLRQYVDDSFVQLDELQVLLERTDIFRDKVIAYSIELVRITELYKTEAEKVAAYADSIDSQLREQVTGYLGFSEQRWEAVLTTVRQQKDLLGALRAVQPILTKAGEYYEDLMEKIKTTALL